MNLAPVLAVLSRLLGLDPATLGPSTVRLAVEAGFFASGLATPEQYAARLEADPAALGQMADALAVPETWFFRGGDLFWYLAEHARQMVRSRPGQPFRALSLPCSTGEEPYSLAIACAEGGLSEASVRILGVDLSARLLGLAARGQYSAMSFRQFPEGLRHRYFRQEGGEWAVVPEVKAYVSFQQGNLITPGLLIQERPFDVVFCRNLFIYLTPAARQQAMGTLARLVRAGGLLCTGHAEPVPAAETRFERAGPDGMFLFRRVEAERVPSPPRAVSFVPPAAAPIAEDHLARARREADAGNFAEALRACLEEEARRGPTAQTQALLGLLYQSRHEAQKAAHHFRRALYLDPNHREAIMHLMLLCDQAGDRVQAAALRGRLQRLEGAS
jgi:chemotaxis protein methyltransferase WspC